MGIQRFVKVDPEKNVRRWYTITWGQTLFGSWAVVRTWGRLGGNWSQCRIKEFATQDEACTEAKTQIDRRTKRDYVPSEGKFRRKELTQRIKKTEVRINA